MTVGQTLNVAPRVGQCGGDKRVFVATASEKNAASAEVDFGFVLHRMQEERRGLT